MGFELTEARRALERTPSVLHALVDVLPDAWLEARPTPDDWNARQVVSHLCYTEEVAWLPRVRVIMAEGTPHRFPPIEHGDQSGRYPDDSTTDLVARFGAMRDESLAELDGLRLGMSDLDRPGRHPTFGEVTLRQLLATWVVHDHNHVRQLHEALAAHYAEEVGPWRALLGVLDRVRH